MVDFNKQTCQTITITTKTLIYYIPIGSILYFECDGTLIKVYHSESDKPYFYIHTLKNLESELSELGFLRICHNRLVNMKNVTGCNATLHCLHMNNGITLEISRRKWHKIKEFQNPVTTSYI